MVYDIVHIVAKVKEMKFPEEEALELLKRGNCKNCVFANGYASFDFHYKKPYKVGDLFIPTGFSTDKIATEFELYSGATIDVACYSVEPQYETETAYFYDEECLRIISAKRASM